MFVLNLDIANCNLIINKIVEIILASNKQPIEPIDKP